jgi:hypothetical protein
VRRCESNRLGRLSKGAQKGATLALSVAKACLPRDRFNRLRFLLRHQRSGFQPEILNRLGWRPAGFRTKDAAELARVDTRSFGNPFHLQWPIEIASSKGERVLHTAARLEWQRQNSVDMLSAP